MLMPCFRSVSVQIGDVNGWINNYPGTILLWVYFFIFPASHVYRNIRDLNVSKQRVHVDVTNEFVAVF